MGDLTNIEATTIVSKIIEETTTYAIIVEVAKGNTLHPCHYKTHL